MVTSKSDVFSSCSEKTPPKPSAETGRSSKFLHPGNYLLYVPWGSAWKSKRKKLIAEAKTTETDIEVLQVNVFEHPDALRHFDLKESALPALLRIG